MSAYRDAVMADSPILYWRLNTAQGTSVPDISGFSRHGTRVGTDTEYVPGLIATENPPDGALRIGGLPAAGTPPGVVIPYAPWMDLQNGTVEVVVRANAPEPFVIGGKVWGWTIGFTTETGTPPTDNGIIWGSFTMAPPPGMVAVSHTYVLPLGRWTAGETYHLALTWRHPAPATGHRIIGYRNGVASPWTGWDDVSRPPLVNTEGIRLGTEERLMFYLSDLARAGNANYVVDEFAVYSTALTQERIQAHFAEVTRAAPAAPLGSLPQFDPGQTIPVEMPIRVGFTQAAAWLSAGNLPDNSAGSGVWLPAERRVGSVLVNTSTWLTTSADFRAENFIDPLHPRIDEIIRFEDTCSTEGITGTNTAFVGFMSDGGASSATVAGPSFAVNASSPNWQVMYRTVGGGQHWVATSVPAGSIPRRLAIELDGWRKEARWYIDDRLVHRWAPAAGQVLSRLSPTGDMGNTRMRWLAFGTGATLRYNMGPFVMLTSRRASLEGPARLDVVLQGHTGVSGMRSYGLRGVGFTEHSATGHEMQNGLRYHFTRRSGSAVPHRARHLFTDLRLHSILDPTAPTSYRIYAENMHIVVASAGCRAATGFFSQMDANDLHPVNSFRGIGFVMDTDNIWRAVYTNLDDAGNPVSVVNVSTGLTANVLTAPRRLAVVLDGASKMIVWLSGGEVIHTHKVTAPLGDIFTTWGMAVTVPANGDGRILGFPDGAPTMRLENARMPVAVAPRPEIPLPQPTNVPPDSVFTPVIGTAILPGAALSLGNWTGCS